MFELIDRAACFDRQGFESHPDQKGTGNMVALNPHLVTLATFQTGHMFACAVQWLDLPTVATRLLRGRRRVLRTVVSDDVIRAVCGHLDPVYKPPHINEKRGNLSQEVEAKCSSGTGNNCAAGVGLLEGAIYPDRLSVIFLICWMASAIAVGRGA